MDPWKISKGQGGWTRNDAFTTTKLEHTAEGQTDYVAFWLIGKYIIQSKDRRNLNIPEIRAVTKSFLQPKNTIPPSPHQIYKTH